MNLRDWLIAKGLRQSDFAEMIDVSRAHLSSVICGTRPAGRKLALAIDKATNGEISADSVLIGDSVGYDGKIRRMRVQEPSKTVLLSSQEKEPCRKVFSLI